jgi:hypothetical protein
VPALLSDRGLGVIVQPNARRCLVLCVRSARSDPDWVLTQVQGILELTAPVGDVRYRMNAALDEALFIGDHVSRHRVVAGRALPTLHVAGSWTRNRYPVDSGESAVLSAYAAVRAA